MSTKVTSAEIVNSTVDASPVGSSSPSSGAFTTLAASASAALAGGATTVAPGVSDSSTRVPTTAWVKGLFSGIQSGNGYIKFPNGLIIQWGQTGTLPANTQASIDYSITFASQCFTVVATTNGGNDRIVFIQSINTTGFVINNNGSGATATWIAIGV